MIVSHHYRYIYIKTAKTAGTSIVTYLADQCVDGDLVTPLGKKDREEAAAAGYTTPHGIRTMLGNARFWLWQQPSAWAGKPVSKKNLKAEDASRFVGQKTWDSYYKFCFERNPYDKAVSLYYFHGRLFKQKMDINEYIINANDRKLSNWYMYTINNEVAVDHIYRFENLESEMAAISQKFGLSLASLPRAKTSTNTKKEHYSKLINREARLRIEHACANEIEYMQYRWEQA